jgi:hypothetical protein
MFSQIGYVTRFEQQGHRFSVPVDNILAAAEKTKNAFPASVDYVIRAGRRFESQSSYTRNKTWLPR